MTPKISLSAILDIVTVEQSCGLSNQMYCLMLEILVPSNGLSKLYAISLFKSTPYNCIYVLPPSCLIFSYSFSNPLDNTIFNSLESLGLIYKINNDSLRNGILNLYQKRYVFLKEITDYHLCPPLMFVNQFHNTLLDSSILQPFSKLFVSAGEPHRDRINCKFSEVSNLENSFDSPFFVVDHIMAPHPPYLFGPNGESITPEFLSIGANSWDDKSGYVNQVQYVNKKIIETIDKILENNSQSVIIIQGDHGTPTLLGGGGLNWKNINDNSIIERMSIFNAYYFPNVDSEIIYDGITPVNSFRLVLNNYLNGDYELLEDKIYFSTYQDMLNFTDVTYMIQK